jgi:hypothetical protein
VTGLHTHPVDARQRRRRRLARAGVAVVVGALAWIAAEQASRRGFVPLSRECLSPATLPPGTVVLGAAEAETVEAPFARAPRLPEEGSGDVLVLPERGGADSNCGRVEFPLHLDRTGTFFAWIRARWDNSCGNSVRLEMDDSPGYLAGEDDVYGSWHWVRAGRNTLTAGTHRVVLAGREDGVAVDRLLFTPDASYVPTGRFRSAGAARDTRRTADNFDRSPGHGLDPWRVTSGRWEIAFSLDPNRIPDQYALTGRPDTNGAPAMAVLDADPWQGVRLAFSFSPIGTGEAGVTLGTGGAGRVRSVLFGVADGGATLRVEGPEGPVTRGLGDRLRLGQWHRVVVERWAWVLRIAIDGTPVFTTAALAPDPAGTVVFRVNSGFAAFDDVSVEEVPWQGEDSAVLTIPWMLLPGARWDRASPARGGGLVGRAGAIRTALDGLPVRAVLIEERGGSACRLAGPSFAEVYREGESRLLDAESGGDTGSVDAVTLAVDSAAQATVRRIAVAYGRPAADLFVEGPYHFTSRTIEDPSDYLDFTPEEAKATTDPSQAGKLRREPRTYPVVGWWGDNSAWTVLGGRWAVCDGALAGMAPGTVQHWRDLWVGFEWRGRVSLGPPSASAAEVVLYAGSEPGVRVRLGTNDAAPAALSGTVAVLPVPADGNWHDVGIRVEGNRLEASVDDRHVARATVRRGAGGSIRLCAVWGSVRFDDVRFTMPRLGDGEFLYAFDRRETDWWREGGPWLDHGGIACALASQWISLVAPETRGALWNKRTFGTNLLVAVTVEENSEWFGWNRDPSHVHHPCDRLSLILSPEPAWDAGYRLEVNARNRSTTVLHRLGVAVATVAQDGRFPLRYRGGHQPYEPRRQRLVLVREGASLRAIVNGQEVLRFDDPDPLPAGRAGVGGDHTRANFSRIEVRELPAERHGPE